MRIKSSHGDDKLIVVMFFSLILYGIWLVFKHFFIVPDPIFIKRLLALLFLLSVTGALAYLKRFANKKAKQKIAEEYEYLLRDAFKNNRKARKALVSAAICFERKQVANAIPVLKALIDFCEEPHDFSSVYMLLANCYSRVESTYENQIECYKRALLHDYSYSWAWQELGAAYMFSGHFTDAEHAYRKALEHGASSDAFHNAMDDLEQLKIERDLNQKH